MPSHTKSPGSRMNVDLRRLWLRIRRVWITVGITATLIFVLWSLIAFRASADAHVGLASDALVSVHHADGIRSFTPARRSADSPALVFFPGALVNPVAYAPLARAAAAAGYPAYIVELPRRGAFGGAEAPELWERLQRLLARTTMASGWVAAGHSRGAVVASQVASQRRAGFAGLILIGTSHPRDVDLSDLAVPVTKIVGTRDGLASPEEVEANRAKLPSSTRWVWIEGGNHSQFGWYGFQPGDRFARIGATEQRAVMIRAVLESLETAAIPASNQ
jgi:pimeloyl-ACP methyl ester carboxylesterase